MEDPLKKYLRSRKIVMVAFAVFLIGVIFIIFQIASLNELLSEIQYTEKIDIVYTWVNGSDERFIQSIKKCGKTIEPERYENKDELKYSLRSLEKYAPWLRHVYIVTNGQIPSWLNLEYEKVSVIPHYQLVQDPEILPTFSSNVIEQFLHLIPNLSQLFLYLNDDIFLGSELYLEDLYTASRGIHVYTTTEAPNCAPLCPWPRLKDGICDKECNVVECEFDGNDCVEGNMIRDKPYKVIPDMYIRSIINSSKMFNLAYGLKQRYMLPHTGFLFEKEVMKDMFVQFRKEFNNTKYNRFRTMDDIQVGYSFAHYLMSAKHTVSAEKVFDHFDLYKSEILSDNEINLLLEVIYSAPLKKTDLKHFDELIINCFKNSSYGMDGEDMGSTFYKNSGSRKLTRNIVVKCPTINELLVKKFSIQNKYTFEVTSQRGYLNSFILLSSNITHVTNLLNQLRKNPKKFNCIGDLTGQHITEEERRKVNKALDDFYRAFFPYPSKFEIPESTTNPYRYYEDYLKWKTRELMRSIFSVSNILSTLIIFFILICCLILKYSYK